MVEAKLANLYIGADTPGAIIKKKSQVNANAHIAPGFPLKNITHLLGKITVMEDPYITLKNT